AVHLSTSRLLDFSTSTSRSLPHIPPMRAPTPLRRAARLLPPAVFLLALACQAPPPAPGVPLSEAERQAIAAAVEARLREATDLRAEGDVLARMLSVYPDSGRVVSASAGMVTVERDSLAAALGAFWQNVGQ